MPLNLNFQQNMYWAWTFARALRNWDWIAGSFKPEAPTERLRRRMDSGRYLLDGGNPPTRMNCWEAVLISGILARAYSRGAVVEALRMKVGTGNSRLMWYMYTSPDMTVQQHGAVPAIPLGSFLMFGHNGDHFAFSLGGELLLNLDRGQKGTKTITWLRQNGYAGGTFWPLYVKRPPRLPADVA